MAITVECPSCRSTFEIEEKHAGKRARCRRCREVFAVPSVAPERVADVGLVPLDEVPQRGGTEVVPSTVSRRRDSWSEDDSSGYSLATGSARKVKGLRARPEHLPGVGASARGVSEAAAPTSKTLTPAEVLAAFGSAIEPVRPSPLYRLWIAIVALIMLLLPLIYFALIGLIVAGLFYHAVNHTTVFQHCAAAEGPRGRWQSTSDH